MDGYEQMANMFLERNKKRDAWLSQGWTKEMIAELLRKMDRNDQLYVHRTSAGKVMGYVGWLYCGESYKDIILSKTPAVFTNDGPHIFPLFFASYTGKGMIRRGYDMLLKKAKERGGNVWSFRHNRIFEFGRVQCQIQ